MKKESLGDLCNIVIGRTPARKNKEYWGKGQPWVSISDMKEKYIWETKEEITEKAITKVRCRLIPKGTLLFSFKLSIGKMAFTRRDLYTNEAIAGLIIKDQKKLFPDYLYYALKVAKLLGSNQAAMGKTLNSKSLAAIQVSIPKYLDDQIRIATLLSRIEALIATRKENLLLLDEFLKSTFMEMFGDYLSNKSLHEPLGNKIDVLTDYHANGSYKILKKNVTILNEKSYALMVRTTDLENNEFENNCIYVNKLAYEYLKKSSVFGEEIIINKIGSAGKVYLMPKLNKPVTLGMNCFLLRFNDSVSTLYIYWLLKSNYGEQQIQRRVKGAVTKTITKDAIRELQFPFPSLVEQNKFSEIVKKAESIKSLYQQNLNDLENLYGSVSQKAFKGELDLSSIPLPKEEPEKIQKKPVPVLRLFMLKQYQRLYT